ncbi:archaetidylserine decarboxylase [Thioalkalivibrio sp. HK1]|uniref:archaetidylserine decarboxylase n=1 Tax=Thioalkalivibrio sp. HK1 TaxID=1469245 RepID=UPI0004711979|nr:archaetidylserine decarboxylase [Thioalkalivibrio sp. HK1]
MNPRFYLQRLLSRLMLRATRIRFGPWKNWQIRWFIRRYGVDMSIAEQPSPSAYPHFNAFFTRSLTAGVRPIDGSAQGIVSPVDGRVLETGIVRANGIIRSKGHRFSLSDLFGGFLFDDPNHDGPDDQRGKSTENIEGDIDALAEFAKTFDRRGFEGGHFATFYLSPKDYHRVHMPITGHLRAMVHVPGSLFSVNPRASGAVDGVFARNERVVSFFDTEIGPLAMVLVGALFVGCIEQTWCKAVAPSTRRRPSFRSYDRSKGGKIPIVIEKGREMGRFNMGSMVVMVLGNGRVRWRADATTDPEAIDTSHPALEAGTSVRIGRLIGEIPPH